MKMMKKSLMLIAALTVFWNGAVICRAEIIPAEGPGQIGLSSVVLCDSLSARKENNTSSEAVTTLHFGDGVIVMNQKDGWAECVLSDSVDAEPAGWVKSEYLAIDPAWYRTDDTTPVYAWNDTAANKVAELDKGTRLPILKEDGEWLVVSLRGASGWIHKNEADRANTDGQNKESSEQNVREKEWTGADYGEGAGLEDNWEDYYGDTTGDGEGAGLEDNWADYYGDTTGDGEGAGLEDNWADYYGDTTGDGEGAGLEDNWADY